MGEAWRAEALAKLVPTPDEDRAVQAASQTLLEAVRALLDAEGWEGEPRIEGSVAKGTYLHGKGDADVFVAFPLDVPREALDKRARVLGQLLDDAVVAYAEHPYAQGSWQGYPAEIVPCYALDSPQELRSAVDRTRFHTDLVSWRLDDAGRDEVRLLKAFLHAAGVYGAEESVAGFSGYLAELAVLAFGGFEETLAWATRGFPSPVQFGHPVKGRFEDPLVVLDPVDPTRNAAAAVSSTTLVRLREAAAAFRAAPSARFFETPEPALLDAATAHACCEARHSRVFALGLDCSDAVLDVQAYAQVRRATRLIVEALEREQVPVIAAHVHLDVSPAGRPGWGWGLLEADALALARPKLHRGPPASAGDHAERFRARWASDPAAVGEVYEEGGRLHVRCKRASDDLVGLARPAIEGANAGKIVDAALAADAVELVEGEAALERVPALARTALLDRRRPWETTQPT